MIMEIKYNKAIKLLQENEPNSNYCAASSDNVSIEKCYKWLIMHLTYILEEINNPLDEEYKFYESVLNDLKA